MNIEIKTCTVEGCESERVNAKQARCREHYNEYMRAYKRKNKPRYSPERYRKNREKILEQQKKYRAENPESVREGQRKWREENEGHTYVDSNGYVRYVGFNHPATAPSGLSNYHRIVLWDKLNGQDVPCHWCGKQLYWKTDDYGSRIVTDHVNTVKDDNRPENLVPACHACNVSREGGQNRKPRDLITDETCSVEFCNNSGHSRYKDSEPLCSGHYQQAWDGREFTPIRQRKLLHQDENGRVCTTCEEYKPWDEFYRRTNSDKRQSECKRCILKRAAQRKANNKDKELRNDND